MSNQAKPIINEETLDNGRLQATFWQQTSDDCGIGEPAILVRSYNGSVEIRQEGRYVLLNMETIPMLCKYLKAYATEAQTSR